MYRRVQKGRGLGGFLKSVVRIFTKALPVVAKISKNPTVRKIGSGALQSAMRVGGEALITNDLEAAAKSEMRDVKKRIGEAVLKRAGSESAGKTNSSKRKRVTAKKKTISKKRKDIQPVKPRHRPSLLD